MFKMRARNGQRSGPKKESDFTPSGSPSQMQAEPVDAEKVDVVIIFSKNCVVAYQWITYLTEVINNIFSSQDRPPTRVTSRDVESLVNCGIQPSKSHRRAANQPTQPLPHPPLSDGNSTFQRSEYQNEVASEQLDAERNARQHAVRKTVSTASLQVVLLSKSLLNHIGLHANDPLGQLLHPKRVIGLMLGLNEFKDITELHISALYSFAYWPKVTMLDQDIKSVTEFRALAQEILNRSQPAALIEARLQPARFKITPRKLRSGEERVTLILLETVENIQLLSSVYVGIESKKNPICVDKLSWLNPYTATFSVPKEFLERGIIVKVHLKVDGNSWGSRDLKCQSKLGEIALLLTKSQLIGSPIDIMCQALNISPTDHNALDTVLAQNLNKKNIPSSAFKFENASVNEPSEEEFPTLLHFASRYGFERLLWTLLECPAACEALNVRNVHGMTPIDQAKTHGHDVIVNNLQSFIDVLSIFEKQTSKSNTDLTNDEDGYVDMNPSEKEMPSASDCYDFLPKPKPINPVVAGSFMSRDIPQVKEPISEDGNEDLDEDPYLTVLPQNGSIKQDDLEERGAVGVDQTLLRNPGSPSSPGSKHRSCTDELREIISDVKNQRLDVRQAAIAFEAWKQRKDVQEDSDKRKEILIRMIEAHRKPEKVGFFKRIFFGKSQSPIKSNEENETVPDGGWSSSDRSSVTSHLSHDSGAHSDSQEERKVVPNIQNDYDVPLPMESSLKMLNYLVPPAPRPIDSEKGPLSLSVPSEAENLPPRPPGRFQTPLQKISPPSYFEFPNRFETIEFNPPQSQGTTGEDLGHILPDEEPYVFEQMSILPSASSSKDQELWTSLNKTKETTQAVLRMDADYMDMTPKSTRKEYGMLTETSGLLPASSQPIDDDYVTASELNMPPSNQLHGSGNSANQKTVPWFSAEVKIEQQLRLERTISNSANHLLSISQEEILKTEWRSDPSLTMVKTPPTKPRLHIPHNEISSPVVLPRPLPRSKPVKFEGVN